MNALYLKYAEHCLDLGLYKLKILMSRFDLLENQSCRGELSFEAELSLLRDVSLALLLRLLCMAQAICLPEKVLLFQKRQVIFDVQEELELLYLNLLLVRLFLLRLGVNHQEKCRGGISELLGLFSALLIGVRYLKVLVVLDQYRCSFFSLLDDKKKRINRCDIRRFRERR